MATIDTNRLESLPLELLEKIIEKLPVPDILRVGQAKRCFYDLIHRSLRIQHKLDLSAAGLEPNWSTDFTLADRDKALEEYRSRWENIDISVYQAMVGPLTLRSRTTVVASVYSIPTENEIRFCTLPSSLRAIEPKSNTIPFSQWAAGFAFNPHADVIVVGLPLGGIGSILKLYLITMSEGVPHPSALKKTIESTSGSTRCGAFLSITCHRLALMVENLNLQTFPLSVWDWRTGELLFEDSSFGFGNFEFLDDYRLASTSCRGGFSELLLLDTEHVPPMRPTLTRFCGPASSGQWACLFGAGEYQPSPQDTLSAPFYPDPSQRILALSLEHRCGFYVIKAEVLLRLARERFGEVVRWEEWRPYLVETAEGRMTQHTAGDTGCNLHVHDFSPHANVKFLHLAEPDDGRKLMRPSAAAFPLPPYDGPTHGISFGHDCMVIEFDQHAPVDEPNVAPDIGKI